MTLRARGGRWLAAAPGLTTAVFLLPVAAGLVGTLLPAFGVLPALGRHTPSLEAWRALAAQPGLATSLRLTLVTGFAAAMLSFVIAMAFCAWAWQQSWARRAGQWLAPVLATPHSALAIGLAFLIAPSGWLVRIVSPGLTGFDVPPDVAIVGDPAGLALVLGLLVKEVPYLVLMTLGALTQVRADPALAVARSLGYGRAATWFKLIVPQLYPQLRLPVYAVLAFSLSVVDVALVLGPSTPPTLAVHALRLFQDPDLALYFPAAAAATLQLAIVLVAILGLARRRARRRARGTRVGRARRPRRRGRSAGPRRRPPRRRALRARRARPRSAWPCGPSRRNGAFRTRGPTGSRSRTGSASPSRCTRRRSTRSSSRAWRRGSRCCSRWPASSTRRTGRRVPRRPRCRCSTSRCSCRRSRSCSACR